MTSHEQKKFILETRAVLQSGQVRAILGKLKELKSTGHAIILPYILDLLLPSAAEEDIAKEVLQLLCDLKEQDCAPVIAGYIREKDFGENLAGVLSSCWQSRLNFAEHLPVFVECFIKGDYQESLEAFTVVEEMLWQTKAETVEICRKMLVEAENTITKEKHPLFLELIKVLDSGESANREDYPDVYQR